MNQRTGTCPQCGRDADMTPDNPARPFCSKRCKLIDLGDWVDGRHSIPGDESAPWPNAGDDTPPNENDDRD